KSFFSISKFQMCNTARIISLFLTAWLLFPCIVYGEINVDGLLDEPEWKDAQIFRDFVIIDPLTLDSPPFPTETRIISLPEGLAVSFICEQPPDEIRTRTTTMRDASSFDSDYVSVMIDFDGIHQVAHEFSVSITGSYRDGIITNQNKFSYDWDGIWQRAVNEEPQRWTVELLLPWSIVAMREGDGDIRRMAICFQRGLNSRNEVFAFPAITSDKTVFMSEFTKIEVAEYTAQQLDISPYITVLSDLVNKSTKGKAGLDLFWKPSGNFQLAATMKPDFGQVESDDLVINFSSTETFFTDKRPFFTENQGLFVLSMPPSSYIIHTRRIGGKSDDGRGISEIDGALKIIGSTGPINYGVLAAQEAGDAGRSFYAGRLNIPAENWSMGMVTTYVERPFLDRRAIVNSLDYTFNRGKIFSRGRFMITDINEKTENKTGYGGYVTIEYKPSDSWRYIAQYSQYEDAMEINDMGYLMRNNLIDIYLYGELRQTDFPEDSRTASVTWSSRMIGKYNCEGIRLPWPLTFIRKEKMKSGSEISLQIKHYFSGYDDLISRGNGLVYRNDRLNTTLSYSTQRRGMWRKSLELGVFQEGYDDWGMSLEGSVSLYPHENLTVDFNLKPLWSRDWLIWLQGDQLASFSRRQLSTDIGATWFPAEQHEVRLRAQWLVINADLEQAFRIGSESRLVPANDSINDFAAINFGLQFRYRYEIGPLSDFYFVYSRGGLNYIENPDESTLGLFGTSTSLRNSDQILVKLRYRF
ncbi:DUF5916 domain-containing protein, partial [Deltaproteobacteria bacterium]|nr:DUF5916 domain-containing protein [Deltaproteobacteria bacterium]